ncbi:MAG: cyclic nucleotide-binding domain-containing protein, partial [Planctomycetes bacterium]|nr:cyclic nucleotide-binding domain-containing protein [Planctomycetota bacterium]
MRNSLIILGVLEDQDIEWFVRVGQTTALAEGEILIEEGIHIESLWFVLDGALTVTTVHDTSKVLGTVYPGEIVGEVSLLDSRPPAVTLIAAESTTVLQISRSELKTKLSNDTGFASRFYRAVGIVL